MRRSIGEIEFTEPKETVEDAKGSIDIVLAEISQTNRLIEGRQVVGSCSHERSRRKR